MKSAISLMLVVICTVVLAAQQSQAKKGCQAYGHVCYGGHGKRSLSSTGSTVTGMGTNGEQQQQLMQQQEFVRPLAALTNQPLGMADGNYEDINPPRDFLIKLMKSWFGHPRRPAPERINEFDYPMSAESYNRDNMNAAVN